MVRCSTCGEDVTGKKFCSTCGSSVQPAGVGTGNTMCPHCHGQVKSDATFCMHCGSALQVQAPPPPTTHTCPSCRSAVAQSSTFCTHCGSDMRSGAASQAALQYCGSCGQQNAAGVRFCGGCGNQLGAAAPFTSYNANSGPAYPPSQPYQQPQYGQPYNQQAPYQQQGPYQQAPYQQAPYGQQQYYNQASYQQPMVVRCPVCMAMAPVGTPNCASCRTSLANVVPTPANMPPQGQQGGLGGMLQGSGGKMAMGALGGAAAVIGGEMLLHGLENRIEDRVEGDMGYGGQPHHRQHHREEGLLGDLGDLANDIGLI